ncbi:MAG: hypothetical protein KAT15_30710, partial [Bacteroidales bacterium]|nr:hypothetical protein [Bacteroidales bacterium]
NAGKAEAWSNDDATYPDPGGESWPVIPKGRGEQIWTKAPYSQEERIAGDNFVLSCSDCHEAHGSSVRSMIRSKLNDLDDSGTVIWNSSCLACHNFSSEFHQNQGSALSCANASCHGANADYGRMSPEDQGGTGTDTLHRMGGRYGDDRIRIFDSELVVDMRFENNLKDSGTFRMHGVWSLSRPNPHGHQWGTDDPAKAGTFVSGKVGKSIEINDQPVEVGTEDIDWSNLEYSYICNDPLAVLKYQLHQGHGTWKYTEMKYNMTLEAWVYPTDDTADERLIMAKQWYWDGGYALTLKKVDGTYRAGLLVNVNGDSAGLRGAFSTVSIPLNQWTHVAATFDTAGPSRDPGDLSAGRIRIYVDGQDVTWSYPNVSQTYCQPGPGE